VNKGKESRAEAARCPGPTRKGIPTSGYFYITRQHATDHLLSPSRLLHNRKRTHRLTVSETWQLVAPLAPPVLGARFEDEILGLYHTWVADCPFREGHSISSWQTGSICQKPCSRARSHILDAYSRASRLGEPPRTLLLGTLVNKPKMVHLGDVPRPRPLVRWPLWGGALGERVRYPAK
jgi:hypothetical protein